MSGCTPLKTTVARVARSVAGVCLIAALAGCAGTSDRALRTTLKALRTPEPAASGSSTSKASPCRDPTASLRPRVHLPPPGHMPAGTFMQTIYRHGRLTAGVNQTFWLFGFFNPLTSQIEGFEIDLLRQIAKAIFGNRPRSVDLRALTAPQRIPFVQRGRVDIVVDNVTINYPRRCQVYFSSVYYDAYQRVLVPSNSPARSLSDLGRKRVCATQGTAPLDLITHFPSHPIPVAAVTATDCLVALQEGRVAAISTDDSILLSLKAQDPNTRIVGPRLADARYGIAISKAHPEFVRFVNGVLARLRADGTWARIYHRWLGRVVTSTPAPPPAHYSR